MVKSLFLSAVTLLTVFTGTIAFPTEADHTPGNSSEVSTLHESRDIAARFQTSCQDRSTGSYDNVHTCINILWSDPNEEIIITQNEELTAFGDAQITISLIGTVGQALNRFEAGVAILEIMNACAGLSKPAIGGQAQVGSNPNLVIGIQNVAFPWWNGVPP